MYILYSVYTVHDGTQDGLLACGGYNPQDNIALLTCEQFRPATASWDYTAFALANQRAYHGSWGVEEGTILLGGAYSEATSEIVRSDDGFTEFMFDLKYETQYVVHHNFQVYLSVYRQVLLLHPGPILRLRDNDRRQENSYHGVQVRIGGLPAAWRTSLCYTLLYCTLLYYDLLYCTVLYCRYGLEGWMEDLPPLNVGRFEHGCGSYVSGGDMVSARSVVIVVISL